LFAATIVEIDLALGSHALGGLGSVASKRHLVPVVVRHLILMMFHELYTRLVGSGVTIANQDAARILTMLAFGWDLLVQIPHHVTLRMALAVMAESLGRVGPLTLAIWQSNRLVIHLLQAHIKLMVDGLAMTVHSFVAGRYDLVL
jgi:hypothetical protein